MLMSPIDPFSYFSSPRSTAQKKYEALRAFFWEKKSARQVAQSFGYTLSALYSLTRDFRQQLNQGDDPFFVPSTSGRKPTHVEDPLTTCIVDLRKQYRSVPEIQSILETQGHSLSARLIDQILKKEGFARLPRRSQSEKQSLRRHDKIPAPETVALSFAPEKFSSESSLGLLCFLPYIRLYGLDQAIQNSSYPQTQSVDRLSSILSFLALKLSNVRRYSEDDIWCMDRSLGLLALRNVLPKAAWFSSYSSRVTRAMNLDFLRDLHAIWKRHGLLSDSMNLDFTAIPYWGDDSHLENNWSGKRNKALASLLALPAQDPDSGLLDYSNANLRHAIQPNVTLEFLDFYRAGNPQDDSLKYLIFDSQFTPYKNLCELDKRGVKFITIRRRGKTIVQQLDTLDKSCWKKIRVMGSDGKGRLLKVYEKEVLIKDYDHPIRQVALTGHGKIKPALIVTNDYEISQDQLIRKYCRRWLIEKTISEQVEFFHLNRVSSSMVIKVDFD